MATDTLGCRMPENRFGMAVTVCRKPCTGPNRGQGGGQEGGGEEGGGAEGEGGGGRQEGRRAVSFYLHARPNEAISAATSADHLPPDALNTSTSRSPCHPCP